MLADGGDALLVFLQVHGQPPKGEESKWSENRKQPDQETEYQSHVFPFHQLRRIQWVRRILSERHAV